MAAALGWECVSVVDEKEKKEEAQRTKDPPLFLLSLSPWVPLSLIMAWKRKERQHLLSWASRPRFFFFILFSFSRSFFPKTILELVFSLTLFFRKSSLLSLLPFTPTPPPLLKYVVVVIVAAAKKRNVVHLHFNNHFKGCRGPVFKNRWFFRWCTTYCTY